MSGRALPHKAALGLFLLGALFSLLQCRGAAQGEGMEIYKAALGRTAVLKGPEPGSPADAEAMRRFTEFVARMESSSIGAAAKAIYATDAYFNDTLKEVQGAEAIAAYLGESLEAVHEARVEVVDVARSAGNYYFIWEMEIHFKTLNGGRPAQSVGMSHIRFDADGRVAFHRDYWDAAGGLLAHLPVIGRVVRYIKGRF